MAMFDRVAMDVIEVALVVDFVADQVLPIASLPDAALAAGPLGVSQRFAFRQALGKGELDDLPA